MIYTKEGTNTRSGESGTFGGVWKIDQNGNESKLIITGSDGKTKCFEYLWNQQIIRQCIIDVSWLVWYK